jgi:hypothetical protein
MTRKEELRRKLDELYEEECKIRKEYEKVKEEELGVIDFRNKFIRINDNILLYVFDQKIVRTEGKQIYFTCTIIKNDLSGDSELSGFYYFEKYDYYLPLRDYENTRIEEITKEEFMGFFEEYCEVAKKHIKESILK